MCKEIEKCEASAECRRAVYSHNETVRDKKTKVARIMCICQYHYEKITGVK